MIAGRSRAWMRLVVVLVIVGVAVGIVGLVGLRAFGLRLAKPETIACKVRAWRGRPVFVPKLAGLTMTQARQRLADTSPCLRFQLRRSGDLACTGTVGRIVLPRSDTYVAGVVAVVVARAPTDNERTAISLGIRGTPLGPSVSDEGDGKCLVYPQPDL